MGSAGRLLRPILGLAPFILWSGSSIGCAPTYAPGNLPARTASAARVEGTATYRERMALPPGSVFEAFLEDVSGNARSTEVARTTVHRAPNPPIRFAIPYDPAKIDPRRSYSVRARILVDGRVKFKSDRQPVLTGGPGKSVELLLQMVGGDRGEHPQSMQADQHRDAPPASLHGQSPTKAPRGQAGSVEAGTIPPAVDRKLTAPEGKQDEAPPLEESGRSMSRAEPGAAVERSHALPESERGNVPTAHESEPPVPESAVQDESSKPTNELPTPPPSGSKPAEDKSASLKDELPAPPSGSTPLESESETVPPRKLEGTRPVDEPRIDIEKKEPGKMPPLQAPDVPPRVELEKMPPAPEPPKLPRIGESRPAPPAPAPMIGAHGLRLPATFRGDFPCVDCEAIRYHLDLWPDQSFHLRREWVGKNEVRDEIGRWRVEPDRNALVLYSGNESLPQFEIENEDHLRPIGMQSTPAGPAASPYELVSEGALTPIDPSLTLSGEMRYMADAPRFTECLTGRDYPIAMEGDYVQLEGVYLVEASFPGEPLYVTFEGKITDRPRMDGEGTERTVVVTRFIKFSPDQRCEPAQAHVLLTNTYWRIERLRDTAVKPVEGRREPHIILKRESIDLTYGATVGCNQMGGTFTLNGENIRFRPGVSTLMACPSQLDATEKLLNEVLAATTRWQVTGNTLELFDDAGKSIASFEAVYL